MGWARVGEAVAAPWFGLQPRPERDRRGIAMKLRAPVTREAWRLPRGRVKRT